VSGTEFPADFISATNPDPNWRDRKINKKQVGHKLGLVNAVCVYVIST